MKFKINILLTIFLLLGLLLVDGCAEGNKINGNKHYVIEAIRPGEKISQTMNIGLKIRKFKISNRFESTNFVYRIDEVSFESDYYNRFLISPASIITEQLQKWLSDSGLFSYVVDSSSSIISDYIVEGNISELYGDFTDRKAPKAVMEIQIYIIQESPAKDTIIYQNIYKSVQPAESNRQEDLVKGYNMCLTEILTSLEKDLQENLSAST